MTTSDGGIRGFAAGERPLEGLRVLEMGSLIAGPFATRFMAEFGAEVIKIERPDSGDPLVFDSGPGFFSESCIISFGAGLIV